MRRLYPLLLKWELPMLKSEYLPPPSPFGREMFWFEIAHGCAKSVQSRFEAVRILRDGTEKLYRLLKK